MFESLVDMLCANRSPLASSSSPSPSGPLSIIQELIIYDDMGDVLFPRAIPYLERDPDDASVRTDENPFPTTSTLTRLFAPLARLPGLKRFAYDFPDANELGVEPMQDIDLNKVFWWKDAKGMMLEKVVVGKWEMSLSGTHASGTTTDRTKWVFGKMADGIVTVI
ncbi:hypothetical protein DL93DRAFT_1964206 [Clavulina sp. PMI_390]|nr:hypothetical protein DL93DRAFT_1964206 [Clavulina sp. PMI_390]